MNVYEGKQVRSSLDTIMDDWAIVGFTTGKYVGKGYGSHFYPSRGPECGWLFAIACY